MKIIQNISSVEIALCLVKEHCMCARFTETDSHYIVMYPAGMVLDGAQSSKGEGKAIALSRLLSAMEKHWIQSGVTR
jgi:hypothetical protein